MAQQSRQSLMGVAMRLYGSFAGKAAAPSGGCVVPLRGYIRATYEPTGLCARANCEADDVTERATYGASGVSQQ